MKTSDSLKQQCNDDWEKAHVEHPFILAMGDGTLSLNKFQYFMRQDYLFLIEYCRVVAIASAKSPDLSSMSKWALLLDETLNSEMELHRNFCSDFGISDTELESTPASPATLGYTDHLLKTAHSGDINELAAALLPCQWGYDEIGRRFANGHPKDSDSFHRRWINGYIDPAYQAMTVWLREFVDMLGLHASPQQKESMLRSFRTSTRYEYIFWDTAWNFEK